MKKKLLFLAMTVCLFSPGRVIAQTENSSILFVAPSRVLMTPSDKTTEINVSNKSDEARRYDLTVVDQVMTEDGLTKRVDTFEYSAKRMLRFVPKRFTLQPGERQIVRVMATRDDAAKDGDYHSHLLFREVPLNLQDQKDIEQEREAAPSTQFEIKALYGIAVPIIVQKGSITSDVTFGDASVVPASEGMPSHLAIEFLRTGNAESSGILSVDFIRNGTSEKIPVVEELWIPIYREADKIVRRIPVPANTDLKGGKIIITYKKSDQKDSAGNPVIITKEISV